jgi:hypothetical protein
VQLFAELKLIAAKYGLTVDSSAEFVAICTAEAA